MNNQYISFRTNLIGERTINLTQTNPILRLKELCTQGKYRYEIHHDRFKNGYMMVCDLYYISRPGNMRYTVMRQAQFIKTDSLSNATSVIAAILLDLIGLGDDEEEETENDIKNPDANFTQLLTGRLGELFSSPAELQPGKPAEVFNSFMNELNNL